MAMIAPGSLVRFKFRTPGWHNRDPLDIYTVLQVDEGTDDIETLYVERRALVLHPGGKASWEPTRNLRPAG